MPESALKFATGRHLCYSDAGVGTHTCAKRMLELGSCCVKLLKRSLETDRICLHRGWVEYIAWRLVQYAWVYRLFVRINGMCARFQIRSLDRLVRFVLDYGVGDCLLVLPTHVNAASIPFFECVLFRSGTARNFKGWKFCRWALLLEDTFPATSSKDVLHLSWFFHWFRLHFAHHAASICVRKQLIACLVLQLEIRIILAKRWFNLQWLA